MTQFILIGGVPRSGTNLARRIVGSHSRIAIPPAEFHFFRRYSNGNNVSQILANKRLAQWGVDFSDLYAQPARKAYVEVLRRYARKVNKEIPGEKSPLSEFFYPLIEEWLADFQVKYIHLVCNPINVIASHKFAPFRDKERGRTDLPLIISLATNWRRSVAIGLARAALKPETYYVLKYEDLTANPRPTIEALCDFMAVEYEEGNMLTLADFATHGDNTSFSGGEGKSSDSPSVHETEDRKSYLTEEEIRIISGECGELAQAIGYADDSLMALPPTAPRKENRGLLDSVGQLARIVRSKVRLGPGNAMRSVRFV